LGFIGKNIVTIHLKTIRATARTISHIIMEQYFGVIVIGETGNVDAQGDSPAIEKTQFVHYPDCQQLSIWLPQSGYNYGAMRLIDVPTQQVVNECPTSHRLNGSIKLLWDTLEIAPGDYLIEIDHPDGWKHRIALKKYPEQEAPAPTPPVAAQPTNENPSGYTVYRDGFGNIMPDEDLIIREKAFKSLTTQFSRRIEYEGTFRAGEIIYVDNEKRIRFSHEMGGGNCMFYIDVPTESEWEARTNTPLTERQGILEYVASTVRSQQASNCRYEIKESEIVYYYER